MSDRFVFPAKEWIDSMDKENLKYNIKRFEHENYQYKKWLSSNTYPIKRSIMRNYLLITMMKIRLEELNDK